MGWLDRRLIQTADRLEKRLSVAQPAVRFVTTYSPHLFGALFIASWYAAKRGDDETRFAIVTSVTAGTIAVALAKAISHTTHRSRPFSGPDGIAPLVEHRDDSSFPSDHSAGAVAFAVGLAGAPLWLKLPAAGLAGIVAVSRIYSKLHWPSDVLAGAAVGFAAAKVSARIPGAVWRVTRLGVQISGVNYLR